MNLRLFLASALGLCLCLNAVAVQPVQLQIQDDDVHLQWNSIPSDVFVVLYRPAFDPATPWMILDSAYPSGGSTTTFIHENVVVFPPAPPGGGGGGGGPPPPLGAAQSGGSSYSSLQFSIWDRWLFEGRDPFIWELERRPPLPTEEGAIGKSAKNVLTLGVGAVAAGEGGAAAMMHPVGSMGYYIVMEYNEDADGDNLPTESELLAATDLLDDDSDNDGITDDAEDEDTDGLSNLGEYLLGLDPLVADNEPVAPINAGGVHSGELDIPFAPPPPGGGSGNLDPEGLFLDVNGNTSDGLIVSLPSPGVLRLKWHAIFLDPGITGGGGGGGGSLPPVTPEERIQQGAAFGGGTRIEPTVRISTPNQALVDEFSELLLDKSVEESSRSIKQSFQQINELEEGIRQPRPGQTVQEAVDNRVRAIHTQWTRMPACQDSLVRRFGRTVNRYLPFLGGIAILATASEFADDFAEALQFYARDIREGEDETGNAAILAGLCNNLSPGAGNIVLNFLLL